MNDSWHCWQGDVLCLNLRLVTRARKDGVDGLLGNRLRIRLRAAPVEGKANERLLEFLAGEFSTARSKIEIRYGKRSRNKCVAIHSPAKLPGWFTAMYRAESCHDLPGSIISAPALTGSG